MTDIDPLSRKLGIAVGMLFALFVVGESKIYDIHTYGSGMDTITQKLELVIAQPEHPRQEAIKQIERFVCGYRSPWCGKSAARILVDVASLYAVDPFVLVGIGVWESGVGRAGVSGCHFGYASCRVRFGSFDEEFTAVARTFGGYRGTEIQKLSIWHTGRTDDPSGYPQRVMETARSIRGL